MCVKDHFLHKQEELHSGAIFDHSDCSLFYDGMSLGVCQYIFALKLPGAFRDKATILDVGMLSPPLNS